MSVRKKSRFPLPEVLVVTLFLVILGFLIFSYCDLCNIGKDQPEVQSPVASDVQSAPNINSVDDLVSAEAALDGIDLDSTEDSSLLDAELSSF